MNLTIRKITKAEKLKREKALVKTSKVVAIAPKKEVKLSSEPTGKNILIIGKKYGPDREEKLLEWLATPPGYLEGYSVEDNGEPFELYDYQIKIMQDPAFFIHADKARQIGFSFGAACESTARSQLQRPYTAIYISINQEEANEKIVFARAIYDSLPLDVKKICVVDNKKSLEFEDSNGDRRSRTRLISHAQREPRGKGNNTDVYLDESAHYIYGERIYVAAVPIVTRGYGRLITGSTPLGKQGIHYEIKSNTKYRRVFSFYEIYWWHCPDLVRDGFFDEAQEKAPSMTTEQRVITYGNDKLIAIFISMPFEKFQQEYELLTVDETISYFSIDLIHACCYDVPRDPIFEEEDEDTQKIEELFQITKKHNIDFKLYETLNDLATAVQKDKINPRLLAGFDIGRVRHNSEFSVVEETGKDDDVQIVRYLESFPKLEFEKQQGFLETFMEMFPQAKLAIDNTGVGMNIGENLWKRYRTRVKRIDFSTSWKEEVCSNMHIRFEAQSIAIPYIKKVVDQIHSIKRKLTEYGHFKFDAEKNSNHHGDIFWAITLGSCLGKVPSKAKLIAPMVAKATGGRVIPIPEGRTIKSQFSRISAGPSVVTRIPRIDSEFRIGRGM